VPIEVSRSGDRYSASVTPPHGGAQPWATTEPMSEEALVERLLALGCHQTDIGDAFEAADPGWASRR